MIIFDPETAQEEYCERELAPQFGFQYESVADCEITTAEEKKWNKHNKKVERLLRKRNGKNWRKDFSYKIIKCKFEDVIAQQGYKKFDDENFKVGDKILAPRIIFDFDNGGRVLPESIDSLKIIADFIRKHPNLEIEIGLHLDAQGNDDYNKRLSERRGKHLDYALKYKFNFENQTNYSIKGYGESNPIIPTNEINKIFNDKLKDDFHRINRRIELKILKVN